LLANASTRANLVSHRLERELRARLLNDHARDDATMRANRANEDRSFRAYENHTNRVELALEANVAIVLARESHAFRSLVTKDYHLSSSYDVDRRRARIFVSLANLAASSLKDVASRRENLVRALKSSQE